MRPLLLSLLLLLTAPSYAQTAQQWRDSLSVLNSLIDRQPRSTDLRLRKAAVNIQLGQWDYAAGAYSQSSLNTAEALCTLWHLSRAKELPKDALDWLRGRVEAGDLAARYRVDGTAAPGYEYHSTAVYGLAALIAREEGDEALFELALRRMERKCVLDWNDGQYGSYSQSGEAPHAFDQLIPLLVNAPLGGRIEP